MGLSLCHANRRRTEHMMASGRARGTNLGGRVRERESNPTNHPEKQPQANKKPTTTRVCYLTNPTQPNPTVKKNNPNRGQKSRPAPCPGPATRGGGVRAKSRRSCPYQSRRRVPQKRPPPRSRGRHKTTTDPYPTLPYRPYMPACRPRPRAARARQARCGGLVGWRPGKLNGGRGRSLNRINDLQTRRED